MTEDADEGRDPAALRSDGGASGPAATRSPRWAYVVSAILLIAAAGSLIVAMVQRATVPKPAAAAANVVVVVDTSAAMAVPFPGQPNALAAATAWAKQLVGKLPAESRVGVVGAAARATTLVEPTSDAAAVGRALDELRPAAQADLGLGAAIRAGANLVGGRANARVVVLTAGTPTLPPTPREATQDAVSRGVAVDVVSLVAPTPPATQAVGDAGGRVLGAATQADADRALSSVGDAVATPGRADMTGVMVWFLIAAGLAVLVLLSLIPIMMARSKAMAAR